MPMTPEQHAAYSRLHRLTLDLAPEPQIHAARAECVLLGVPGVGNAGITDHDMAQALDARVERRRAYEPVTITTRTGVYVANAGKPELIPHYPYAEELQNARSENIRFRAELAQARACASSGPIGIFELQRRGLAWRQITTSDFVPKGEPTCYDLNGRGWRLGCHLPRPKV